MDTQQPDHSKLSYEIEDAQFGPQTGANRIVLVNDIEVFEPWPWTAAAISQIAAWCQFGRGRGRLFVASPQLTRARYMRPGMAFNAAWQEWLETSFDDPLPGISFRHEPSAIGVTVRTHVGQPAVDDMVVIYQPSFFTVSRLEVGWQRILESNSAVRPYGLQPDDGVLTVARPLEDYLREGQILAINTGTEAEPEYVEEAVVIRKARGKLQISAYSLPRAS